MKWNVKTVAILFVIGLVAAAAYSEISKKVSEKKAGDKKEEENKETK